MSDYVSKFTLEQHAHNHGYTTQDVKGCPAENTCCIVGEEDILVSGIDMVEISDLLNDAGVSVETQVSYLDCGRYSMKSKILYITLTCPYTYFAISMAAKMSIFRRKIVIFFLFLIVGTC